MEFWKIAVIAVGLGGDAFSVALGIGSKTRFRGKPSAWDFISDYFKP
ncbi:MAG TPA: hypothetical protein PK360_05315 [bacterium]|nr:hypothetical protein [bacterium]